MSAGPGVGRYQRSERGSGVAQPQPARASSYRRSRVVDDDPQRTRLAGHDGVDVDHADVVIGVRGVDVHAAEAVERDRELAAGVSVIFELDPASFFSSSEFLCVTPSSSSTQNLQSAPVALASSNVTFLLRFAASAVAALGR
jgi:hypothetical protein